MKTSLVLFYAKNHLADSYEDYDSVDKNMYICHAIRESLKTYRYLNVSDYIRVRNIVESRLDPYTCFESWLRVNHGIDKASFPSPEEYFNKLQATRHAWVDSMIEEFKAKGD